MDFLELARRRYSALCYESTPIEPEQLKLILHAGQLAPTACNFQPQRILLLTQPEQLERVRQVTNSKLPFGAAMLVCYDRESCWYRKADGKSSGEIDASIVTTRMMLEATQLGLGSIWVMSWDASEMKAAFAIPEQYEPVALLILGHLSKDATVHDAHFQRKALEETVFRDSF
jgi:nitroreductase